MHSIFRGLKERILLQSQNFLPKRNCYKSQEQPPPPCPARLPCGFQSFTPERPDLQGVPATWPPGEKWPPWSRGRIVDSPALFHRPQTMQGVVRHPHPRH
ncbi:hypothetical protein CDAR_41021 [Caerostris darwini]|uniref:Uncharacterized protein n=1 Tax=Caerostris darwini TaxID=1538125 RepID=A0AAV4VH52_9ARAC|nr:hypothetical protein CDAR_41021 [Caerostris darwini]